MVWEAIFLLVVLKIPIVYLCLVVWWAIRAEPRPEEGAHLLARVSPTHGGSCDWHARRARRTARSRGPRPRTGGPARAAHARAAQARAEAAR